MAKLSGPDEAEYKRLQDTVARIDRLIAGSTASSATTSALVAVSEHARARMEALEDKARVQEEERQQRESSNLAASMAAKEEGLNKQEREQYRQFLEKDHFTKGDFAALEGFYTSAWERLSEDGKDQMSQRVWGGVKRGEYQFTELPEVVKEKEADRLEEILKAGPSRPSSVWEVPEADRADFMKARDQDRKQESFEVLNRPSFAAALGDAKEREVASKTVDLANAEEQAITVSETRSVPHASKPEKIQEADQGTIGLEDLGTFADPLKNALVTAAPAPVRSDGPNR